MAAAMETFDYGRNFIVVWSSWKGVGVRRGNVIRLALLALIWGSSFLWIKLALEGLSPVQIAFTRLTLGAGVLLGWARMRGLTLPRGRVVWAQLVVAAVFANAIPFILFAVGEQTVDTSLAGIMNATTPLWTIAVALTVRHERHLSGARAAGLLLGFAGTVLILAPWQGATAGTWGAVACGAAALSYGISFVFMDRFLAGRGIPPVALAGSQLLAGAGLLALVVPFAGLQPVSLDLPVIAAILILGAVGTGIAYVLNYRLITDDGATVASTVTYLIPVAAVALGVVVLGEPLHLNVLAGMVVVLAGIALTRRKPVTVPALAAAAR
jgi:drug/metabolite transporter (DMT)-like permease